MFLVIFPFLVKFVTTFIIRPIYYTLLSESTILLKTDNRLIVGIIQMSNDTYQYKMIFSEKNLRHKKKEKDGLFAIDMQADFSFKFYTNFWISNTLYIMNRFINILLWTKNSNHELHSLFFARYDERPSFHRA